MADGAASGEEIDGESVDSEVAGYERPNGPELTLPGNSDGQDEGGTPQADAPFVIPAALSPSGGQTASLTVVAVDQAPSDDAPNGSDDQGDEAPGPTPTPGQQSADQAQQPARAAMSPVLPHQADQPGQAHPVAPAQPPYWGVVRRWWPWVSKALVGVVLLVSVWQIVTAVSVLSGWNERFSGRTYFTTEQCESVPTGNRFLPARFNQGLFQCQGEAEATTVSSDAVLVGARAALPVTPRSGTEFEVYFDVAATDRVYPMSGRFVEPVREVLALLPFVLLLVGSVLWLAWSVFGAVQLHGRSLLWLAFGGLSWIAGRWWLDLVLGSIGVGS